VPQHRHALFLLPEARILQKGGSKMWRVCVGCGAIVARQNENYGLRFRYNLIILVIVLWPGKQRTAGLKGR
jgi:hypothetical protein